MATTAWAQGQRVLLLQSYHKADWSDSVLAGVRAVLDTVPNLELFVDYMDTKKADSKAYLDLLDSTYRLKYAKLQFDALLTVDDPAYQFFLKRGTRIWGSVPMSFCGVNRFQDSAWLQLPRVTGVVEQGDFYANIQQALRFRPKAEHIYIVSDSTQTGLSNEAELMETLKGFPQIKPMVLSALPLAELEKRFAQASPRDFAFFISLWKDRNEQIIHPDTLGKVFKSVPIPVFGRSEWLVGKGLTGGLCVSGFRQGKAAALKLLEQMALDSLQRTPVLRESPNVYFYDYRLLSKHNLSIQDLPNDALIIHRPSSAIRISKSAIGWILGGIALITGLLILLVFNYKRRLDLTRKLAQKESEYRLLIESQTDLVVKVDQQGQFLFASPSYCKYFQISEADLMQKSFQPHIYPDDLESTLLAMQSLYKPPYTAYLEQRVVVADGIRWMGWNDTAVLDSKDQVVAIIGVGRDITEQKDIEAERERLIAELERKNHELEQFAYSVSHDLKSPLVTIIGFSHEILEDLQVSDFSNLKTYAERVIEAGSHMSQLLEAILALSRVGATTGAPTQVPLAQAVQDALSLMEMPLRQAGATVEIDHSENWPSISADQRRFVEVLQNVIENAIKYKHPERSLLLQFNAKPMDHSVVLEITDNGIGIEPDQLDDIFGLFRKLNPKSDGLGFGLALCKQIIEVMDGRIWVESAGIGKGSRFCIRLPQ